jgi:hypothetical protein
VLSGGWLCEPERARVPIVSMSVGHSKSACVCLTVCMAKPLACVSTWRLCVWGLSVWFMEVCRCLCGVGWNREHV